MARTPADQPDVLSVSELTAHIKGTLETQFPSVWVAGEISDLARPRSGHLYFTLKDSASQIRGVMWRSSVARQKFVLEDGQLVICQGSIDVYAARGSYQLVVRRAEPQGVGAMQLALQQLQQKLADEGLFAAERKRPLPSFPNRIGIVTSPTGAAVRDFLEVARRRWPGVEILVIPAVVQGNAAKKSIVEGIIAANAVTPSLDVLVVGRGGGSLEDLWCFNEELVVRAIAASSVPTVSAVGHEIDVTLSDMVADVRALTPSAAAEIVVPDMDAISHRVTQLGNRLLFPLEHLLAHYRGRLDNLNDRPVFQHPFARIHELTRRLDELDLRSRRAIGAKVKAARQQWNSIGKNLSALSPLETLQRGYSITFASDSSSVLRNSDQCEVDDVIVTRLAHGEITSRVVKKKEEA